jgi:hypothetical protein
MMTHRARIHEHDGGFIRIFGESQAAVFQMTPHLIGVGHIHLATVGANEEFHRLDSIQGAPAAETLIDLDLTLCYAPWVARIDLRPSVAPQ